MLIISIAIDENKGIGYKGQLPWHLKEELAIFKKNTIGKNIVMGQTTYDNLPRRLKDRHTVIVSADKNYTTDDPEAEVTYDLISFLKEHENDEEEYIICGGASIFRQAYPYAKKAYVSFIKKEYEVDTYFDVFDLNDWEIIEEEDHKEFIYCLLKRKENV